jgi:hypothetical protein
MSTPTRINCIAPDWRNVLKTNLQEGLEVELINFDYTLNGQFCEMLAMAHRMRLELDVKNKAGFFKKEMRR